MKISRRMGIMAIAIIIILVLVFALVYRPGGYEAEVIFHSAAGDVKFNCEVADTNSERSAGLMNRESLDADAGMLFMFDSSDYLTFWMKNTLIPLDIIFIDEEMKVINVEEANPEPGVPDSDLTVYRSDRPARWVVEINQGICLASGIGPGTDVTVILDMET